MFRTPLSARARGTYTSTVTFWANSYPEEGAILGEETITVTVHEPAIDIKPGSWPNPINQKSKGLLPVAICGSEYLDVMDIDPSTVKLYREGYGGGSSPVKWSYEDVTSPWTGDTGGGWEGEPDGYLDIVLHFKNQEVVEDCELTDGESNPVTLYVTFEVGGEYGEFEVTCEDYVWVLNKAGKNGKD
jgi:hypothetical protein